MICENCGKQHDGSYGSGRFCSSHCARGFSTKSCRESINCKVSKKLKGTFAYSNGSNVIYLHPNDTIPEGYVRGNFNNVRNYTFEEFRDSEPIRLGERPNRNREIIRERRAKILSALNSHNMNIIKSYESLLQSLAIDKEFSIDDNKIILYAKYQAIIDKTHPRAKANRVFVHTLLAETLLGRELNADEIVHHKNENKLDNRFDNIYIFNNKSSHARFHMTSKYFLKIDNDVLICEKFDIKKLDWYESMFIDEGLL